MSNPFQDSGAAIPTAPQAIFAVPAAKPRPTAGLAGHRAVRPRSRRGRVALVRGRRRIAALVALAGAVLACLNILLASRDEARPPTSPQQAAPRRSSRSDPQPKAPRAIKPARPDRIHRTRSHARHRPRHRSPRPKPAVSARPSSTSLPHPTTRAPAPLLPAPVPAGAPPEFL
jgi:hypothetical protein